MICRVWMVDHRPCPTGMHLLRVAKPNSVTEPCEFLPIRRMGHSTLASGWDQRQGLILDRQRRSFSAPRLAGFQGTCAHEVLHERTCKPSPHCGLTSIFTIATGGKGKQLSGFTRVMQRAAAARPHIRMCSRQHKLHTIAECSAPRCSEFKSMIFVTNR